MTPRKASEIIGKAMLKLKDGSPEWERMNEITIAPGYCEPGYNERGAVVFGNWNPVCGFDVPREVQAKDPIKVLADRLEKGGAHLEWSDEWATCSDCGKAFRTSPDSYGWQQSFAVVNDEMVCAECIKKDPADYLESLEGNCKTALTFDLDISKHGYTLLQDKFDHGFHRGQDADPKLIAKELESKGVKRYLFKLDSTGQFDFRFSVWVHDDEIEKAKDADLSPSKTDGPSVAGAMERGLREASLQSEALAKEQAEKGGVIVTKVGMDGATVKLVSLEDFVAGKALD